MHISKEQRCHLNFSVQLILAVSYFADLNPKVPGLILFFLCLCHSKSLLVSFFLQFPVSREPADSPHVFQDLWLSCIFPQCLYSQFVLYRMKKGLIAQQILETLPYNIKGLTENPWGKCTPTAFFRVLHVAASPSLYPLQMSASKLRWRE